MALTLPIQNEEEIEQANRFRTYLNYLSSISDYLGDVYSNPESFLASVIQSRTFQNIQGGRCSDLERLSQLLRNAWFTEIQISMATLYEEFVPYTNHWLPVQAYYSSYLALRAYFYACGQDVGREHTTNLKSIGEEIQRRSSLFPRPWSVICSGNPEDASIAYHNLPDGVEISEISSLTSSHRVSFWDSYAKFLKTTRKRHLDKQCEDWKIAHSRQRVDTRAKRQFLSNLSPTTLFNCLYRLRLRSNYADADSFLLSVHGSIDANTFHTSLKKICWCTLSIMELLIARYITKREFSTIVDSFRRYEQRGLSDELIGLRWGSTQNLW